MPGDIIAYQREDCLLAGLNYVPYFEPEVDLHDRKAVIEYCDMLYEKRNEAYRNPISGGWSFIANISPVSRETPAPDYARPLPQFACTGGNFRFTLIEGLQPMEEFGKRTFHRSQVWVAQVTGVQADGEDAEETVVVKIIQASLIPAPDGNRRNPWELNPSARQLACSEDLFYDVFPLQQGIQIPWYFGKFLVEMPNGEDAYVLIMEHIKGCTLPDWLASYAAATTSGKAKQLQSLKNIVVSIYDAYGVLSQEGVWHKLGSLEDIIITSDNHAVVIDFADTPVYDTIAEVKARIAACTAWATNQGEDVVNNVLQFCWSQSGEYASQFLEWASDEDIVSRAPNWHKLEHSSYIPLGFVI